MADSDFEKAFQSTRPSRASTMPAGQGVSVRIISIHKALAGLDMIIPSLIVVPTISIHKALAGLDNNCWKTERMYPGFQSTRPSRASTAKLSNNPSTSP